MNQEEIEKLIKKQKQLREDYQSLLDSYDVKEVIKENESLKQELRKYERELDELEEHLYNLRDRNERLRLALRKQIIDERMKLLKISRQKLELYFSARANDYKDRLTALEDEVKTKLEKLEKKVEASLSNDKEDILADIEKITDKIDDRIKYRKKQFEKERTEIKSYYQQGQEELANRDVEDKDLEKRQEENDLREQTSLDWLKKSSFVVLAISLIAISRYAYVTWFNQILKMGFIYLLGVVSIGIGEFIFKSEEETKDKFAQAFLAIGVLIFYFATFKWWTNSLLAVGIITIIALYLVVRHYSQPVLAIALAGGYSPIVLRVVTMLNNNAQVTTSGIQLSIIYTLASFLSFSLVIIYALSHYHSLFQLINEILLGINNLISFLLMYWLLSQTSLNVFLASIPLSFIIFYVILDKKLVLDKYSNLEWKRVFKLFNIIFLILLPVVQTTIKWWALGWLIEGLAVVAYLFKVQRQRFSRYSKLGQRLNYFKYFAVISSWGYLMYFSLQINSYTVLLAVAINFILAYGLQNIKLLNDKITDYISAFFYIIGDLLCIYATLNSAFILSNSQLQEYFYWGLLVLVNCLLVVNLRQLIIAFLEKYKFNLEFYPLTLGGISAVYLTLALVIQMEISITGLIITFFYFAVAVLYILYGLYRRFIYARLTGLFILVIVATKFFIYDLSFLAGVQQLGAYLGLGVSLLLIYFSYQKLKNKIAS